MPLPLEDQSSQWSPTYGISPYGAGFDAQIANVPSDRVLLEEALHLKSSRDVGYRHDLQNRQKYFGPYA